MRAVILFISLLCLLHIAIAAPIHEKREDEDIPRPRIFFITLYTEPENKGASETFETKNGAESPCWNITLPKVSSYSVDDKAVSVTFFKDTACIGEPVSAYNGTDSGPKFDLTIVSAQSVKIQKIYS